LLPLRSASSAPLYVSSPHSGQVLYCLFSAHHVLVCAGAADFVDERSKKDWRQALRDGSCENCTIKIEVPPKNANSAEKGNNFGVIAVDLSAGDLMKGLRGQPMGSGKKSEKREMKVSEAR
jgi:ATP-dependent protease HslVU (ClpYQ) ATPase subunit